MRSGRACPNCGAELFRSSDREAARDEAGDEDLPSTGHPPTGGRGSRAALGLVALLGLLAVVTFRLLPSTEPGSVARPQGGDLLGRGRLVVAAGTGEGEALWVLDLASGGSARGPRLPSDVVELVDVSSARPDRSASNAGRATAERKSRCSGSWNPAPPRSDWDGGT